MDDMGRLAGSNGTLPWSKLKQLYLGTRYTALLGFILSFIDNNSSRVPCQVRPGHSWISGAIVADLNFAAANYGRDLCEAEHPITFVPPLSVMLTFTGIALCQFGICVSYHCSPSASHPRDSWHLTILIIYLFPFRVAIWDRNVFVSLFALGLWLACLSLNIYSTSRILQPYASCSHFPCLGLRRFDHGAAFHNSL